MLLGVICQHKPRKPYYIGRGQTIRRGGQRLLTRSSGRWWGAGTDAVHRNMVGNQQLRAVFRTSKIVALNGQDAAPGDYGDGIMYLIMPNTNPVGAAPNYVQQCTMLLLHGCAGQWSELLF